MPDFPDFSSLPDFLGLPIRATEHSAEADSLMYLIHLVMLGALILWTLFFVVPLIRYRKGKRPRAMYRGLRSPLPYVMVGIMAAIETVLLIGYSLPYWERHVAAETGDAPVDPFRVRVVAQQFTWVIHYPGPDGKFGRTDVNLVDDVMNIAGIDHDDPAARDDITLERLLHLPVDRPVELLLSSKDVIHSFGVPEFRIKQDAIPGMVMPVRFTPNLTSAEFDLISGRDGRGFEIVCSQLCGIMHFTMIGYVTVETQEEFDAWYAEELAMKIESDF